jgi:hypothetical protein
MHQLLNRVSVCTVLAGSLALAAGCAGKPDVRENRSSRQAATANSQHAAPSTYGTAVTTVRQSGLQARVDDPVVMQGKAFPALQGVPPQHLALMRCEADSFSPIPMQIDEKTPEGNFAFLNGPKRLKDNDAGFDGNDELVFIARDTGARCLGAAMPNGARTGAEIEVRDPAQGTSSWLYLFAFETSAPTSNRDYVKAVFDRPDGDWRIEADSFVVEFARNALYYNYISLRKSDGTWTPNMVDRLKIRGSFGVFFDTLQFNFEAEELSKTKMLGWTDGPVRVLFHLSGHFEALIKVPIKADLIVQVLPTYFIFPLHLDVPIDLATLLSRASLHGINDFSRHIYDFNVRFYDKHNPMQANVVIDGILSDDEWLLNYNDDRDWIALVGDHGVAALNRVYFPTDMDFISKRLYIGENPGQPDPPESEPGIVAVGYDFDGILNIKKGGYTFFLHFYFPPGFAPGDEARILNITDRPLQPVVRNLTR